MLRTEKILGVPRTRIMLAADLPDFESNARLVEEVGDLVDVIKVSSFLAYREGASVFGRIADRAKRPVFADLKIADVPHTNAKIVETARSNGASAVMVHGFLGPDGIEACLDEAKDQVAVIVQMELTSPGGLLFNAQITEGMASLAASLDVHGVQAPGNRPDRIKAIRNIVGPDYCIVSCGVGAQGGSYQSAIEAGATYAIIGRAIYGAEDRREAAARMRMS